MSDILSIRIHDGGNLEEREIIVLPKGTTVYAPGATTIHTTGPVCEVNVSISGLPGETVEELAMRVAELIRKGRKAPPDGEEIHLAR